MIFCVQGRATQAPTPPQTQPQRRNVLIAVDTNHPQKAKDAAQALLEKEGFSFVTLDRTYEVAKKSGDPALDSIVDQARRNGIGLAVYQ